MSGTELSRVPKCSTALANEQAVKGYCWRHEDTLVEARELEQWFLRTKASQPMGAGR